MSMCFLLEKTIPVRTVIPFPQSESLTLYSAEQYTEFSQANQSKEKRRGKEKKRLTFSFNLFIINSLTVNLLIVNELSEGGIR